MISVTLSSLVRTLVCLVFFTALASAQNRAQFPWWNSPVAKEVGLSPAQTARIRNIVHSYRDRLFDVRNEVQKAEAALDELMNEGDMNAKAADPVIGRVVQARANASRVFLEMSTHIREVLTYEQWRQLVERWDEVKGKRVADGLITPQ
jgi:Spy/CpxP family protein refolding chaperone